MPPKPRDERKIEELTRQIAYWEEQLDLALQAIGVKEEAERVLPWLRQSLDDAMGIERNPTPELGEFSEMSLIEAVIVVLGEFPPGPVKIQDTLLPILLKRGANTGQRKSNKQHLSEADNPWKAVRTACSMNPTRVIYNKSDDTVKLPRPR
jgi:hypothetical protein